MANVQNFRYAALRLFSPLNELIFDEGWDYIPPPCPMDCDKYKLREMCSNRDGFNSLYATIDYEYGERLEYIRYMDVSEQGESYFKVLLDLTDRVRHRIDTYHPMTPLEEMYIQTRFGLPDYFMQWIKDFIPGLYVVNCDNGYTYSLLCNHRWQASNKWITYKGKKHRLFCPMLYYHNQGCCCHLHSPEVYTADEDIDSVFELMYELQENSKEATVIETEIHTIKRDYLAEILTPAFRKKAMKNYFLELTTDNTDLRYDEAMVVEDVMKAIDHSHTAKTWKIEAKAKIPFMIVDMIKNKKFDECSLFTAIDWMVVPGSLMVKFKDIYKMHIPQSQLPRRDEKVEMLDGEKRDPKFKPEKKKIPRIQGFTRLNNRTWDFIDDCKNVINKMHCVDKKRIGKNNYDLLSSWVNSKRGYQHFSVLEDELSRFDFGELHDSIDVTKIHSTHKSVGNARAMPMKDLPIKFTDMEGDILADTHEEMWQQALFYHYTKNPHHPEYFGTGPMTPEATIECMFDLLASAMRLTGNAREAFVRIRSWIWTKRDGFFLLNDKFQNLDFKGLLWFYIWILRRGLFSGNCDFLKIDRNTPPSEAEKLYNYLDFYNKKNKNAQYFLNLPKTKLYIKETRQHISIVEKEMQEMRLACKHDRDKLKIQMIAAYVYKWFIPKEEFVQTTSDTDYEDAEPGPSDEKKSVFDKMWNKVTDTYNGLVSKLNLKEAVVQPLEETRDAIFGAISKLDGVISNFASTVMEQLKNFFGYLKAKIPTILSILELLYAYIIWVKTDNFFLKLSAFFTALHALDLFDTVMEAFKVLQTAGKEWFSDYVETTSDQGDESWYKKIFDTLTDICPRRAGLLCSVVIAILCGAVALKNKKIGDLGNKVIESMKNIHFVGAGMLGIERIFKYVVSITKTALEWIGDNIFGLGKGKEEEKKAREEYATNVFKWGAKVDFYVSAAGVKCIRESESHCLNAKNLVKQGFEYIKHGPHPDLPKDVDIFIRARNKNLQELFNLVHRTLSGGQFRHTPFHVQFYGKAGVGKSTLHKTIASKIQEEYYPQTPLNRLLYSPMESTANGEDWDGYDETKKILVVDEMFKILDAQTVTQWVNIISCAPLMLPMATMADKGIHLAADWVISNTNVAYPRVSGIASNEAVWRRRHLLVETICDKDVFDEKSSKYDDMLWMKKFAPDHHKRMLAAKGDKVKISVIQKELTPLRKKFPHLKFNLCSPIDCPDLEVGESGVKYLNPLELPSGVVEPTKDLSFDELWHAITSRRAALYDEEDRSHNTGTILEDLCKYEEELLEIIDNCAASGTYRSLIEKIRNHLAVPITSLEEDEEEEDEIPITPQDIDSELENPSDLEEPNIEKKLPEEVKVLKIDGDVYIITVPSHVVTKDGIAVKWSEKMARMYSIAYDFEDWHELVGKFQLNIETTSDDMKERMQRLKERKAALLSGHNVPISRWFGIEQVKHIFRMPVIIHRDSNVVVPKNKNDPPLMCHLDNEVKFLPIKIHGSSAIYNEKYGSQGCEKINQVLPEKEYSELCRTFSVTKEQHEKHPQLVDGVMSLYYLNKIVEREGSFYYCADHEDGKMIEFLENKYKLKDYVPVTRLCYLENFTKTMNMFTTLPDYVKRWVLSELGWQRTLCATLANVRKIHKVTFRQGCSVLRTFFWEPIKFVWRSLARFHSAILKVAIAIMVVQFMIGMGHIFCQTKFQKPYSYEVENTSKQFVKVPKNIVHKMEFTAASEVLANMASKNLFEVDFGSGLSNALGIRDHYFVVNAHTLPRGYEESEYVTMRYKRTPNSDDWWQLIIPSKHINVLEKKDLAFIYSNKLSPFKNIVNHFRRTEDYERHPITSVTLQYVKQKNNCIQDFIIDSLNNETAYPKNDGKNYILRDVICYNGNPVYGSSGGIIYTQNNYCPRNLLGIQCARYAGKGLGTVLTQETIEEALSRLPVGVSHQGPFVEEEGLTTTSNYITSHVNIVGVVPEGFKAGEVFKSDFHRTPIAHLVPESKRIPAILSKKDRRVGENDHPLAHSINKCGRDVVAPLDPKVLQYAEDQMVYDRVTRLKGKRITTLSFEETLRGLAVDGCTAINTKTSPGIPYIWYRTKKGKKSYLEFDEMGEILYVSPRLKEDFEMQDNMIRKGILPPASMYEFPKDELRPIAKALGPPIKTRSISVCPLVLILLYRKYNLAYDASMQSNADGTQEFCVGINPESRAWTVMYESMQTRNDKGADLDVGNWDGHFPMDLKEAITNMRNKVYKKLDPRWTPKDDIARNTLSEFPIFGHTQFEDLVLQKNRGQSSGWGGTASENTDGHEILSDYIVYKLLKLGTGTLPSKTFVQRYICKRIYGDDIFYVISDELKPHVTIEKISGYYTGLGWPVTSAASKTDSITEVEIDRISFLKRTFKKYKYGTMLAALDESVIYDMLYWQRRSADPLQLYVNLNLALKYMFPHGRDKYNELANLINSSLDKVGLRQIPASYYRESCWYDNFLFN